MMYTVIMVIGYVAGVGNDPRDRKFNIRKQAERYDENGKFNVCGIKKSFRMKLRLILGDQLNLQHPGLTQSTMK